MLQSYTKQEDIPEALREHYSKREDGKWYADIADDHPTSRDNVKLKSEKATADNKVTELSSDLEKARAGNLGRGQVAIAKSDAELLDKYKAHGTPDEVGAKLTEHKTLAEESVARKRSDSLRQLATDLKYNPDAFALLANLPEFVSRPSKDGKTTDWFAQIKDDKGVITEKPAKEFIESSPQIAPFMPSLKQSEGVRVPTTGPTTQPVGDDPFAWSKQFAENYMKTNQTNPDLVAAFNFSKPAA